MNRLPSHLKRLVITAMVSSPILAQTEGCLGMSTNELREAVSVAVSTAISAGLSQAISLVINRALDVPTGFF
jgi:hypothetical protein